MQINEGNTNNNDEESKIVEKLRICMYLLFVLSFFRLFCSQFYGLITDLIAGLIVYCTYTGKGRIMSLFCLINSILGVIYSISIGSMDISRLNNKTTQQKSPDSNIINNNTNNNNNFLNSKYDSNGNYNPNYKNSNNNYFDAGSQENFNALYNSGLNNNNNNNINNNINNGLNSFNGQDSMNYTIIYITAVMVFAVLLYCVISFFSYKAYKIFKNPFGDIFESEENDDNNNNTNRYGRNNYGGVENSNQRRQSTGNFVPFGGSGQRLYD